MPEASADSHARHWPLLARLLEPPVCTARLKASPDDFQVREELGFALSGAGEHICIEVEKTDLTTTEVSRRLGQATGLRQADIGYAGMKDRRARTSQWFSLRLPEAEAKRLHAAADENLRILRSRRNHRKIRIGSHRANHFVIRLRDFYGERDDIERRLRILEQKGVPNYFGPQRFGRLFGNVDLIEQRIADETGGKNAAKISRVERARLYSAARALLFNQVLSTRLKQGGWDRYLPGDVLSLDGSGRLFLPVEGDSGDSLRQRLDALDIHVTGPLPGAVPVQLKYVTRGQAADIENAILRQYLPIFDWLKREGLQAGRRPLRFVPRELSWNWTKGVMILRFALARGCYATSVIRELCNTDGSEKETEREP